LPLHATSAAEMVPTVNAVAARRSRNDGCIGGRVRVFGD
jgi:hypothetical protein